MQLLPLTSFTKLWKIGHGVPFTLLLLCNLFRGSADTVFIWELLSFTKNCQVMFITIIEKNKGYFIDAWSIQNDCKCHASSEKSLTASLLSSCHSVTSRPAVHVKTCRTCALTSCTAPKVLQLQNCDWRDLHKLSCKSTKWIPCREKSITSASHHPFVRLCLSISIMKFLAFC